jgi:hypothetical protein
MQPWLAGTRDDALDLCARTSGLPFDFVHEKHAAMLWPGLQGAQVHWSSKDGGLPRSAARSG